MTPGQYARRGCAQEISYCLGSCTLGRVLIASTTTGVCAVLLGESDEELVAELASEFGEASLVHAPGTRAQWTQDVLRHLDDTRIPLALPLDYRGTPFQIRVWKALRSIPSGEKQSYSELAAALGTPRAVRAVASACAQNTIAVLVPCHRVLRKDGALAGYRWGVERKAALLAREFDEPNRRPGADR